MEPVLGIDYGEKHCGIATASTFIAEPVTVISTDEMIAYLQHKIPEWGIKSLVFGLSERLMAEKTKAFAQTVAAQFGLPVTYVDETLSSQETRTRLAQLGAKRKLREAKIDHYVAAAILQEYLDNQAESDL